MSWNAEQGNIYCRVVCSIAPGSDIRAVPSGLLLCCPLCVFLVVRALICISDVNLHVYYINMAAWERATWSGPWGYRVTFHFLSTERTEIDFWSLLAVWVQMCACVRHCVCVTFVNKFHVVFTVHLGINFQFFNQQIHFLFSYFCSIHPTHVSAVTLPSSRYVDKFTSLFTVRLILSQPLHCLRHFLHWKSAVYKVCWSFLLKWLCI